MMDMEEFESDIDDEFGVDISLSLVGFGALLLVVVLCLAFWVGVFFLVKAIV